MVSPFIGRIEDIGWPGMDLIRDVAAIYRQCGLKTEILAASVRGTLHVIEAAKVRRTYCHDDSQSAGPTVPASLD